MSATYTSSLFTIDTPGCHLPSMHGHSHPQVSGAGDSEICMFKLRQLREGQENIACVLLAGSSPKQEAGWFSSGIHAL